MRDEVQDLIDSFAYCFHVKVTVHSLAMEEIGVGLKNPGSDYCRIVQNDLKLLFACHARDREMCSRAGSVNRLTRYRCHAGLLEAIIPVRMDGAVIGYMMIGQIRDNSGIPDTIMAEWKRLKGNDGAIEDAFLRLSRFDEPALQSMLKLFSVLVSFIVSQNYMSIRHGMLIDKVSAYINAHLAEPITLSAAAAAIGWSESAISHALKRELHLGFSRLVAMRRVEKFETTLGKDPSLPINEVAASVGCADPLYFSRLYKKLRLVPPSVFVRSLRSRAE